jgi:hypothetical protein
MTSPVLNREFEYYVKNQETLVKQYKGKFIVIKGDAVIGDYETILEAYKQTEKNHEVGTFLIQLVEPGSDSYTQTFHSRVFV